MKALLYLSLLLLVGCRSWPVRMANGGEPVRDPCKWECVKVDEVCYPYLECWE